MMLLYIDPGTGSMLFSILIALATAAAFGVRAAWMKLRFIITRGKKEKADSRNRGIVIFSDDKRYWNVFGPICREAERRGVGIVYMTQSADDMALKECEGFAHVKAEFIGEGNKGIAKMNFLVADIVLATTPDLDVLQWKRSREVRRYVHTLHGTDDMMNYKMFALDSYDAVLLTGDFQKKYIRRMEEMRHIAAKELVTVGYQPMDEQAKRLKSLNEPSLQEGMNNAVHKGREGLTASFAQQNSTSNAKHCGSLQGSEAGAAISYKTHSVAPCCPASLREDRHEERITILVAPSWGKSGILSRYAEAFLRAVAATGYRVIVRPHPQTVKTEHDVLDPLVKAFPASDVFEWNYDTDNFECMRRSDILITDFSAIVYDWALVFDKPLIYAGADFDTATYDAAWFEGEKLWRFTSLNKMGIKLDESQFGNMKDVIDAALSSDTLKDGRAQVRSEAWQHQGEAAKLIVDYLVKKQKMLSVDKNNTQNKGTAA